MTTGSAVVNGTVDPNGEATRYWVEYGTTSAYGVKSSEQVTGTGTDPVDVKVPLTGLTRTTTYHYRVVAENTSGQSAGVDRSLRTASPAAAPSIASRATTGVNAPGATLKAGVNPRGLATTVRFEYGTSTSYGSSTPDQAIGAGAPPPSVKAAIAGLKPGTRYNYRTVRHGRGHRALRQPHVHDFERPHRRRHHALDGPPDLGLGDDGHRHRLRRGVDAGRAGEAGVPVHRRLHADRDRQRQQWRLVHADRAAAVRHLAAAGGHAHVGRRHLARRHGLGRGQGGHEDAPAERPPRPGSRVRRGRRSPPGSVSLQRQSRSGKWMYVKRARISALAGGRSRYRFSAVARRSRAMNYRVVVLARNGGANVPGNSRTITIPRR